MSPLSITAVIDPLSKAAQKIAPILSVRSAVM